MHILTGADLLSGGEISGLYGPHREVRSKSYLSKKRVQAFLVSHAVKPDETLTVNSEMFFQFFFDLLKMEGIH